MRTPPIRPEAKRIRWVRVLWVAALLCAVTWVLVLVFRDPQARGDEPAAVANANAPQSQGSVPVIATVPLPKPSPARAVATSPAGSAAEPCSAQAAAHASGPVALSEEAKAAREAHARRVFEQTFAALSTSADPHANAIALVLRPLIADLDRIRISKSMAPCEGKDCARQAASAAESAAVDAATQVSFDQLARMAANSTDPRIYAMAFHVCGSSSGKLTPACQLLSAEQWARLDPDNAVPWGFVAAAAAARNDGNTLREATHRMAQARRSHIGWGVMAKRVTEHAPAGEAALEASYELVAAVVGFEAAWVLPHYQTIVRFCNGEALSDANRRQTCSDIAEVMTTKSDTLLEVSIGRSIGLRAGWPAQRIDTLKEKERLLKQAIADATADPTADPANSGCAGARRMLDYFQTLGPDGELSAMRRLAEQAPSSLGARGDDRPRAASYPAPAK